MINGLNNASFPQIICPLTSKYMLLLFIVYIHLNMFMGQVNLVLD